jgi:hypothetical protein
MTASSHAVCRFFGRRTIVRFFAARPAAATRKFPLAAAGTFGRLETWVPVTAPLRRATATGHQAGLHDQCERESDVYCNPEHLSDLGVTQVLEIIVGGGRLVSNPCANCRTGVTLSI